VPDREANAGQQWLILADAGNPSVQNYQQPHAMNPPAAREAHESFGLAPLIAAYREHCPDAMLSAVI
jgi:hypothetical protein